MKYHINPRTGVPSVCYATQGKCPYGDDSSHFPTFGEAQNAAFQYMTEKYPMFNEEELGAPEEEPVIIDEEEVEVVDDIEKTLDVEEAYSYLEDLTDEEIIEELEITRNQELLEGVLSRRLLVESDNDDGKYVLAVTRNPFFPQEILDDVIINPDTYDTEFVKSLVINQELNEKTLFDVAKYSDLPEIKRAALSSRKISANSIVMNVGEDGNKACPELALYFAYNPNTPPLAKSRLMLRFGELMSQRRGK